MALEPVPRRPCGFRGPVLCVFDPFDLENLELDRTLPFEWELREYFRHVDNVLDLSKDVSYNTVVVSAKHIDNLWKVETADGQTIWCTYLIPATGSSYKKHVPAFPGLDQYKGRLIHAADWPHAGLDVTQSKVAVIGNGASGVQLVQELGKQAQEFTLFVRTPIHAMPMRQRKVTAEEQEAAKSSYIHFSTKAHRRPARGFLSSLRLELSGMQRPRSVRNCSRRAGIVEDLPLLCASSGSSSRIPKPTRSSMPFGRKEYDSE